MKQREEIIMIIKHELPFLRTTFHVKSIALFGSYARNEQTEESDLDLLVEFSQPVDFFELFDLEDFLSQKTGVKTEVVTYRALKDLVKETIEGDLIHV
ncbi:MAG: nucleotidyltransferase family protein [Candidatus Kariarchaeaceae archaeon]